MYWLASCPAVVFIAFDVAWPNNRNVAVPVVFLIFFLAIRLVYWLAVCPAVVFIASGVAWPNDRNVFAMCISVL